MPNPAERRTGMNQLLGLLVGAIFATGFFRSEVKAAAPQVRKVSGIAVLPFSGGATTVKLSPQSREIADVLTVDSDGRIHIHAKPTQSRGGSGGRGMSWPGKVALLSPSERRGRVTTQLGSTGV